MSGDFLAREALGALLLVFEAVGALAPAFVFAIAETLALVFGLAGVGVLDLILGILFFFIRLRPLSEPKRSGSTVKFCRAWHPR